MTALRVAIIGCGLGGACVVTNLGVRVAQPGPPGELILIDRTRHWWHGRAYQPDADYVLANAQMAVMSLIHRDPWHAVRWAENRGLDVRPSPAGVHVFLPRSVIGQYIDDAVAEALGRLGAAGWRIRYVRERATVLAAGTDAITIQTGSNQVRADRAVLCVGDNLRADTYGLTGAPGYVEDPYPIADMLPALAEDAAVGVLGSGLAAVDVVVGLQARGHRGEISLFSRGGILPSIRRRLVSHQYRWLTPQTLDRLATTEQATLVNLIALAEAEVTGAGGDFAALAEDFRHPGDAAERLRRQYAERDTSDPSAQILQRAVLEVGQDYWSLLSDRDRALVLDDLQARLISLYAPMPRDNAAKIIKLLDAGQLRVRPGIRSATAVDTGFEVLTGNGPTRVDVLVNTVTPGRRQVPESARKLIDSAVDRAYLVPHPFGGIVIDTPTGRAVDPAGTPHDHLFALGELTSGAYYFVSHVALFVKRADAIAATIVNGRRGAALSPIGGNL
jgi:uncharacterized NAD(P)/FAD-binding protein YdhS